jgi:hypothetical protein
MACIAWSRTARRTLVAGVLTVSTAVAVQLPSTAGATTTAQWKSVQVCAAAHRGHMGCFAERLVRVGHSSLSTAAAARQRLGLTKADSFPLGPAGGYTPGDLASAYGANVNASAAKKMTVAIVDAFGNPKIKTDLATFNTQYGIAAETATSFRVVNQTGGSSLPAAGTGPNAGWATEESLDVQAVRGLCRKCKIVLVQANTNSNSDLDTAENTAANVIKADIISNSFGGPENPPGSAADVSSFNHPGVAVVASTGDDGWYSWDAFNEGGQSADSSNTPSNLKTVVAVGGTSLYLNPNGSRAGEQVWNNNGPADVFGFNLGAAIGAAGGGCSQLYNAPGWQKSVAHYSSLGCGAKRSGTDIAAVADPFTGYDINDTQAGSGWETIGGTSLATPVISALWALAGGPAKVKYPALTLYGHFKSAPATYDVTVGGTGACSTATVGACSGSFGGNPNVFGGGLLDCAFPATGSGTLSKDAQCYARPGYDGVSGVGTPKGLKTFVAMNPTAAIAKPGRVRHGHSKTFDGSPTTDPFPGGKITKYSWDFGDGGTGTGVQAAHTYAKKGKTFKVTLTVTDKYGQKGKTHRSITTR